MKKVVYEIPSEEVYQSAPEKVRYKNVTYEVTADRYGYSFHGPNGEVDNVDWEGPMTRDDIVSYWATYGAPEKPSVPESHLQKHVSPSSFVRDAIIGERVIEVTWLLYDTTFYEDGKRLFHVDNSREVNYKAHSYFHNKNSDEAGGVSCWTPTDEWLRNELEKRGL